MYKTIIVTNNIIVNIINNTLILILPIKLRRDCSKTTH